MIRFFHYVLGWWAGFVSRHPWWVLVVAVVAAAGSVAVVYFPVRVGGVVVGPLGFQSNRNDLISGRLDWNKRFIDWQDHFPGAYDLYVVVDAGDPAVHGTAELGAERVRGAQKVVDELEGRLGPGANPHIERVVCGDYFSPRALRLAHWEEFEKEISRLADAPILLESPSLQRLIGKVTGAMRQSGEEMGAGEAAGKIGELTGLVEEIGRSLKPPESPAGHRFSLEGGDGEGDGAGRLKQDETGLRVWNYFTSENGRLYFLRITPRREKGALNAFAKAIAGIREQIEEVKAAHPGFDVGLTGIEVVEADETEAATWDSTWTSVVAAVLITVLLVLAFHGWRSPVLQMTALLFGIAWSFGFAAVAVGHLQVISVVFVVMLLGLGIAYGIYLDSRFELVRHQYADNPKGFAETLKDSMQTMGPGIFTGAVTTSAAFVTTLMTDFKGVAEMGLIAGVGVMLCWAAMFSVFPALLRLFKPGHRHITPMGQRWVHFYVEERSLPFVRHGVLTMAVVGLLAGASVAVIVTRMSFDYDLLKMQPRGVASVEWTNRIVRDGGESIWAGVSIVSGATEEERMAEVKRRKGEFMKKGETVAVVRGIGLMFPDDDERKVAVLDEERGRIGELLEEVIEEQVDVLAAEVDADLYNAVARLGVMIQAVRLMPDVPKEVLEAISGLDGAIVRVVEEGRYLGVKERVARSVEANKGYRRWRRVTAERIRLMLDSSALTIGDLPSELMRPYVEELPGGQRRYVMEIYPRLPKEKGAEIDGPLHPKFLPRFIGDMKEVDAGVTGVVAQVYYSGDLIKRSYQAAGLYAFVIVLLLVWLGFGSVVDSLHALLPAGIGFAGTFGLMWLLGMKVNPANIIVLPLMFGIGVDSGVHMLFRARMEPGGRPLGLTAGTGKGITITCLTTIIGFAAMILARHRGIQSLGFVLSVGILFTMLACLTFMPAWLEFSKKWGLVRVIKK